MLVLQSVIQKEMFEWKKFHSRHNDRELAVVTFHFFDNFRVED